jgi:PAS domain S-box-containing protein
MLQHLFDNTPYAFNPLAMQTLIVALGLIALGIYGLIREQGSQASLVFFILALSIGVWLFAFSWMYSAIDEHLAMWWAKVAYVGVAFIPAAVYHFTALILQDYEKVRKRVLAVWVIGAIFIILILTTDIQFRSLYRYAWGYYPKSAITSVPFILFFFSVMILTLLSFVEGYRNAAKGSAQLTRARTLLIAFAVGYLAATDFIASFGIRWYPFGYLAIFIFIVVSARSIFRYRFMAITPAFAARLIIDTMKDALIVLDPDGVVRLVNQATCTLLGFRENDIVGKQPTRGMIYNIDFAEKLEAVIRGGTVHNYEFDYQPPDSARRVISVSTSIMHNPAREPLATVCVMSDITDQKRAEGDREKLIAQLQEANEKFQEANAKLQTIDKMKSDFVSVVSHELRTPLTTIKAFIEILNMKPRMPEDQKAKLMNTINVETDRLTLLISDLLDLARIEAGSMKWRIENIFVDEIIQNAVSTMMPLFENKNIRLTTALTPPLSPVAGDRDRLLQVVTNILSNAVKFTPTGGSIHIAVHEEKDPAPQIVVEIIDTGMGIRSADLELIFEKFHRSGDPHVNSIDGTGLGLAIARQIVEYHGGRIWAASTFGMGSTFTFTLPSAAKEIAAAPSQA